MLFPASCRRSVHSGKIKSRPGWKTLLDFCSNLKICQFVGVFHADDMLRKPFPLKVFLEFILSYFWSKDLDLGGVTNMRDNLVIIFAEMVPETPVAYILR